MFGETSQENTMLFGVFGNLLPRSNENQCIRHKNQWYDIEILGEVSEETNVRRNNIIELGAFMIAKHSHSEK